MNVLAIGAHFDDIELGCGGTIIKHVNDGDKVFAYVATLSGFTNHSNIEIRSNSVAFSEGKKAMDLLGIKELICGKFKTLQIEFDDKLNVEIIKIIEEKKIDLIYTHWTGDVHHDHKAVALSSLMCGRHVSKILMYRSNWYHSNFDFKENFYVDITKYIKQKEDAIRAHKSEVQRTNEKWISFFRNESLNAGQRIGVKYAEVFELVKWLES